MRGFFDLLLRNPILLLVLGAWLVGMIGNILKAQQKARQRRPARPEPPVARPLPTERAPMSRSPVASPPTASPAPAPRQPRPQPRPVQSPEEIAREMRRILGLEPEPAPSVPPAPPRRPVSIPAEPPPSGERPPTPVRPQLRPLATRVDPHVGDQIRERHMRDAGLGRARAGLPELGSLGGRAIQRRRGARAGSHYLPDDLQRAFVLMEILGPPVALRPFESRRIDG